MSKLLKKLFSSAYNVFDIAKQVSRRQITLKYGLIRLKSQLSLVGLRFIDGVNWESYHADYKEEIKIIEKNNTILINRDLIELKSNKIFFRNKNSMPLLNGHKLLYETILNLNPESVLEVGCGGGDHLYNLNQLNPNFHLHGLDRSSSQLNFLNSRHPNLSNFVQLETIDITNPEIKLPRTTLVFTQAVLMHISEKNGRFREAFDNLFKSDPQTIFLIENWTQHDFLGAAIELKSKYKNWENAKIYHVTSDVDSTTRGMLISKNQLNYSELLDYNDLLQGKAVSIH